jgi:hypothetical protein
LTQVQKATVTALKSGLLFSHITQFMLHHPQDLAPLTRQRYPLGTELEKPLCLNPTLALDQRPLLEVWPFVAGSFQGRCRVLPEQEAFGEASGLTQNETEYEAELLVE